jgi:hypothetical protein
MVNQRVERITELLAEGNLAVAQELVELELNERVETVKAGIKGSFTSALLEACVTGMTDLGEITVDTEKREAQLKVPTMNEALEKAAAFASWCDGVPGNSSYKATIAEGAKDLVKVSIGGKDAYDMIFESDTGSLIFSGDFTAEDLASFKREGKMPAVKK